MFNLMPPGHGHGGQVALLDSFFAGGSGDPSYQRLFYLGWKGDDHLLNV
jgi:hypothetical protein